MKQWFVNFWNNHPISTHSLAMGFATLVTLYAAVPAFKALVDETYAVTPAWGHKLGAALLGIWMFYNGTKQN
jgi:hypothetical protein